jgi:Aldehyde dehydrogenase family
MHFHRELRSGLTGFSGKRPAVLEYRDVYAGGRLVGSGSSDVITIVNPATEEVIGAVPSMVERDVEVAVAAARQAFHSGLWPLASPADRAAAMERLVAALEARAEDTARLVTAEMGMPIALSRRSNVAMPCAIIRYYAALARDLSTEEIREAISFAGRTVVRREPAGVAAVIASWSYPLIRGGRDARRPPRGRHGRRGRPDAGRAADRRDLRAGAQAGDPRAGGQVRSDRAG